MLLVDDLVVRPFVGLLEVLHGMAVRELYAVDELQDELKENRLRFEVGERSEDEYERRRDRLEQQLERAQSAREQLGGRARVIR